MIPTFGAYISEYVIGERFDVRSTPGEHHFVTAYLVPKLYALNGLIPDYINPDGTKAVLGDVVYYRDGKHHLGIEAKVGVIRLTTGEFNNWIANIARDKHPDVFIGISSEGIALCTWWTFRSAYVSAVCEKKAKWSPRKLTSGYGPLKNIDLLRVHLSDDSWFAFATDTKEQAKQESAFTRALSALIGTSLPIIATSKARS